MQRYLTQQKIGNQFIFNQQDTHHVKNVMRMKIGDFVEIVDESTVYLAKIDQLEPTVVASIDRVLSHDEFNMPKVTIAQSLLKEQKFDFLLQKGTELGVDSFIPLAVARSLVKLEEKKEKKQSRWQTIVKEASEQSKRTTVPFVDGITEISHLVTLDYDVKLLCTVNERSTTLKNVLSQTKKSDKLLIVIGPEGGFTPNEEDVLLKEGFIPISLGELVLRSETVALYIMSAIQYQFMR